MKPNMESSSQMIKPCRVQITDLRRMKNRDDHFNEALSESSQQPSTSGSSGKEPAQGACTVLIVPNQETSASTSTEEEPSEGTMLLVSEDGWIKGEPKSPEGLGQTVDGGKSSAKDDQHSGDNMSGTESDFDIDENDGEDDDWIPDPGSDSDDHDETESENKGAEPTQPDPIDPDEPLTTETLKKIMEVVYGVAKPNVATLVLLKEQMDERPKLKLKLLKDLQRGNSMFKRRKRAQKRIVVKTHYIETPSQVKANNWKTDPQWTPHQPLTLAKATAHLAAQQNKGDSTGSVPVSVPTVPTVPPLHPRLPQSFMYRPIAPKPPPHDAKNSQINGIMNTVPASMPKPSVAVTSSSVPSGSNIPQSTHQSTTNITFRDQSHPSARAFFMPENRTVKIPELHPSPTGSLDVLVPVDINGQMKEPFMGIPLDSCKLVFGSDSEEATKKSNVQSGNDTSCRRSKDDNQSTSASDKSQPGQPNYQSSPLQQPNTQSNAAPPSAGVFPNPQSATAAAKPTYGIPPTPASFPPKMLPPGMVPVGLVPANARPPGVFPPHMFPPGSIPPGMVPVPLPPDALRFPVPGPHVRCTCPPGSRPPGPPVHSLLHIQQEDLNRLSATRTDSPALSDQSVLLDNGNESPRTITSTNNSRAESPGIKIASVRSCTSNEDLINRASASPKALTQPSASASRTAAAAAGMGNHPGSLLTVILPSSAQEHYKHKLNPQSKSNPLSADLKEIHSPATKVDLGLVWNEISLLRTEIHLIKTKVASDIHNIRTDMEEFVKLVGARLGITPVTQPNETVKGNEGGKKRKAMESEGEKQNSNKHAKTSSE